jgi:ribosomal protein S18 acetylase RimI-like enzyme
VRDAAPDDAAALIRIREVMLASFLDDVGDGSWRAEATVVLREQLEAGAMIGVLAEVDGSVAAGALARVWRQLPGPDDDGRRAWIFSVATEEPYRRRGLAREVVTRLVERLDARGLPRIDLTASDDGMGLYLSLGFAPSDAPLLRRRRPVAS